MKNQLPIWIGGIMALALSFGINVVLILMPMDAYVAPFMVFAKPDEELQRFWSFRSREIERLMLNLEVQKKILSQKEYSVAGMESMMNAEKEELAESRRQIETLRSDLIDKISQIEKSEEKNLGDLAKTYSSLLPATTVEIFKQMDDVSIVKIIAFMEAESLAPIFQAMVNEEGKSGFSAKRVAKLTELLRLKVQEK